MFITNKKPVAIHAPSELIRMASSWCNNLSRRRKTEVEDSKSKSTWRTSNFGPYFPDLDEGGSGAINHSPSAQIPADHASNREVITKKLILCPISSQEPSLYQRLLTRIKVGLRLGHTCIRDITEKRDSHALGKDINKD